LKAVKDGAIEPTKRAKNGPAAERKVAGPSIEYKLELAKIAIMG
jgi:hypothetical protein